MKVAFIINPIAGTGKVQRIRRVVLRKLALHPEVSASVYITKNASDTLVAARRFLDRGFDTLVAVGGDGTVNQIGSVLVSSLSTHKASLGIVPTGSGNGLARHLRISMDLNRAVEQVFSGKELCIDACKLNEQYYFCTAGLGFDAHVGHLFNSSSTRGLGRYAQIVLEEYASYKPLQLDLTIDGVPCRKEAFLLTVANAAQWGNNFYIAPHASIVDGLLQTVFFDKPTPLEVPIVAGKFIDRSIDRDHLVEELSCRTIEVSLDKPTWFHYDGESLQIENKATFTICPQALWVRVPSRTPFGLKKRI